MKLSLILGVLIACQSAWAQLSSREVYVNPNLPLAIDGGLEAGEVMLTFDDGPDPVTTRRILSILKKFGVRAIFFQVGQNAQPASDVTREILQQGHAIGSHSWDHPDLTELPFHEAIENIKKGHSEVVRAAGSAFQTPFFRFPHFSSTPELRQAVHGLGLVPIHANIVPGDWLTEDSKVLLDRALRAVDSEKRGIIIFHDIRPVVAEMLDEFLSGLADRKFRTVVFRPQVTLSSLAGSRGIRMGTTLFAPKTNPNSKSQEIALREFNSFTMPAYFRIVQPEQNRFDFSLPDETLAVAPPSAAVRGHALAWCENSPDWLKNEKFTGAQLENILVSHITTVIEHYKSQYPGRVVAWDVVNEPFSWKDEQCVWNRIGLEQGKGALEYVRIALRAAHAADPSAKLYINDFAIEGVNAKSDAMYQLVSDLKSEGVPLDGLGMQSHFVVQSKDLFGELPPVDQIVSNMNRFADLGIETSITEADFSIKEGEVSESTLAAQADGYRDLMRACLRAKRCKSFTTWGIGDDESWIPRTFPGWGTPLLFDSSYAPKPAYSALKDELSALEEPSFRVGSLPSCSQSGFSPLSEDSAQQPAP